MKLIELFTFSSLLAFSVSAVDFSKASLHISCWNADVPKSPGEFCELVTWQSATIYASSNFTVYSPGPPLSSTNQNQYAKYIFNNYAAKMGKDPSGECYGALQRLACVQAFPECPVPGQSISSISYFLPCRMQCSQVNDRCSESAMKIPCDPFPQENCILNLPTGYFILPLKQVYSSTFTAPKCGYIKL